MKLAIIVLSCLVGLSYQQRYIWPMPYAPRAHLTPLFYADGRPAEVSFDGSLDGSAADEDAAPKFGLFANALTNVQPLITVTTTATATSTLVVPTPVTSPCIMLTAFATASPGGFSTTACSSRRRRAIEDGASIEPSTPQLEVSDLSAITVAKDAPEIESSHDEDSNSEGRNIVGLAALLTKTVGVTSTVTTTYYSPLVVQKTVTAAGASGMLCLPAGYQVCTEK